MLTLDRSYRYQFALFFNESMLPRPDATDWLPQAVSAAAKGPNFGLKLGHPQQEQVFVSHGAGQLFPSTAITWRAGSGVWRLTWSVPSRLDLYFDARGFADITDSELPDPVTVQSRVAKNLALVAESLGPHTNRLAFILTLETSRIGNLAPGQVVAKTFFNKQTIANAEANQILDIAARVNHIDRWDLADSTVPVNRIEAGTANVAYRDGAPETSLAWQFDVNTAPTLAADASFKKETVESFFEQAAQWCSRRMQSLEELR